MLHEIAERHVAGGAVRLTGGAVGGAAVVCFGAGLRLAARAFRMAQHGQNQEHFVQGPDALTQHAAAERFVAAYPNEKLSVLTTSAFLMRLGRPFSAPADYGWHITEAFNHHSETFETQRTRTELGKPETDIEEFARRISK